MEIAEGDMYLHALPPIFIYHKKTMALMNFENKGSVPANGIRIYQEYFLIKEFGEKPEGEPIASGELAKGISILPNQMYLIPSMTHLKTLKDKLFKEYGQLTEPGFLYIHTDIKYHGIKEKPQYFQDTVYLFRWFPAHAEKEVFHLLESKSN